MSSKNLIVLALAPSYLTWAICGNASTAHAANISASVGTWTAGQLETSGAPAGVGSSSIAWGTSVTPGGAPSSYSFTGRNNFVLPENGTPTSLGVFTHNNFTITLASDDLESATLAVNLSGDINKAFTFAMNHFETTNNPPAGSSCAAGGFSPCPDLVSFSNFVSAESVDINGQSFLLEILGFQQSGIITPGFLTLENQSNSAELIAQLTPTAVPTPALLPGLIGFGISLVKKRASQA